MVNCGYLPQVAVVFSFCLASRLLFAQPGPKGDVGGGGPSGSADATVTQKTQSSQTSLEEKIKVLESKVSLLEEKSMQNEACRLQKAAEKEVDKEGEVDGEKETLPSFYSTARSLQVLNPELSLVGDFVGRLYFPNGPSGLGEAHSHHLEEAAEHRHHGHLGRVAEHEHSLSKGIGFEMRVLELVLAANVDPYSSAKVVLCFEGGGLHLEEAYASWVGVARRFSISVGRFRQPFGVVNRWHKHSLDQVDLPLALRVVFGEEGLVQTGASFSILLPRLWAHAQELTIQVTNAENDSLFAGDGWSIPSVLGHLRSYYDLSPSTYLEIGLSGLWGLREKSEGLSGSVATGEAEVVGEAWHSTVAAGVSLTLSWVPPRMAKRRGLVWRSEGLYLHKETSEGTISALTGFTYLDVRVSQLLGMGVRLDAGQDPRRHGGTGADAEAGHGHLFVQVSPYVTVWQSEWMFLRLQYQCTWYEEVAVPEHLVMLQVNWAVGPHRHEKY